MNQHEQHQEARRQGLHKAAERRRAESDRLAKEAQEMQDRIPFGQPILVGHHSEVADRNFRDRIDKKWRKSSRLRKEAEELERRAESVGSAGVSSDDPDAIDKLREKVAKLRQKQEDMKAVNKALRIKDRAKGDAALAELGLSPATIEKVRTPDVMGSIGFPRYAISNNNANIRRIEKRIEAMERQAGDASSTETIGAVEVVDNVEENRVQIVFPSKPDAETRKQLKSWGFRWAPSAGVWQRHRSNSALHWARQIAKSYTGAVAA